MGGAGSSPVKGSQQPCSRFSFSSIQKDDDLVRFYAGLPSVQAFQCLYRLTQYFWAGLIRNGRMWNGEGDHPGGNKAQSIISLRDQLFLTVVAPFSKGQDGFCDYLYKVSTKQTPRKSSHSTAPVEGKDNIELDR